MENVSDLRREIVKLNVRLKEAEMRIARNPIYCCECLNLRGGSVFMRCGLTGMAVDPAVDYCSRGKKPTLTGWQKGET